MNVEFLQCQLKNKTFLFLVFLFLLFLISCIIYYTKCEEERKKESNQEVLIRIIPLAFFISLTVVAGLWIIDFPKKEKVFLEEDFWE